MRWLLRKLILWAIGDLLPAKITADEIADSVRKNVRGIFTEPDEFEYRKLT